MNTKRLEKASEYAEKCFPSDDISNSGKHDVALHSYIAGANWMLEKAMALIEPLIEHCEVFDRFGRQVKSETFRKVLEE